MHFPSALVLHELALSLLKNPREHRRVVVALVRSLICKHSVDQRYQVWFHFCLFIRDIYYIIINFFKISPVVEHFVAEQDRLPLHAASAHHLGMIIFF
jgi:hypothetical protein